MGHRMHAPPSATATAPATAPAAASDLPRTMDLQQQLRNAERQRAEWIARLQDRLARHHELQKHLLLAVDPSNSDSEKKRVDAVALAVERIESGAQDENEINHRETSNTKATSPPVDREVERREELKQLELKAQQLVQQQQEKATVLSHQLQQLRQQHNNTSKPSDSLSSDGAPRPPRASPPRDPTPQSLTEDAAEGMSQYPEFSRASEVTISDESLFASAVLRVALRFFLHTNRRVSISALRELIEQYTGASLNADEFEARLRRCKRCSRWILGSILPTSLSDDARNDGSFAWRDSKLFTAIFSGDGAAERISAWIKAENQALHNAVIFLPQLLSGTSPTAQVVRATRISVLAKELDCEFWRDVRVSLDSTMADPVASGSNRLRILSPGSSFTTFPQLSGVLMEMEDWLKAARTTQGPTTLRTSNSGAKNVKYKRPFSLEDESVLQQVKMTQPVISTLGAGIVLPAKKRQCSHADPMKVLCMYELGGVCNDENCPFQHQRDFEDSCRTPTGNSNTDPSSSADHGDSRDCDSRIIREEDISLVRRFVQLRLDVSSRWPTISTLMAQTDQDRRHTQAQTQPCNTITTTGKSGSDDANEGEEFMALGSPLSSTDAVTSDALLCSINNAATASRYYVQASTSISIDALEDFVGENPEDVNAWIVLALRCLKLDFPMSDDLTYATEAHRLTQEFEELYRVLQSHSLRPSSSSMESVDTECVKRSLHMLSRALEVEANAYSEELWLFHLRLSELLINRDVDAEVDMAEKALEFLPSSVLVWRQYLSIICSANSLAKVASVYIRLLQFIAGLSRQEENRETQDQFSVLMCDVVIQLCAKYCRAGVVNMAVNFLGSFLAATSLVPNDSWQKEVVGQMMGDEVLTLFLILVHLNLWNEVPLWLEQRGFAGRPVNVDQFALSVEFFVSQFPTSNRNTKGHLRQAIATSEAAISYFADKPIAPMGLEVLRSNWVIISALSHGDSDESRESVMAFADELILNASTNPRHAPRVFLTTARVLEVLFPDEGKARSQYILDAMVSKPDSTRNNCSRYGEAVHNFLLHSQRVAADFFGQFDSSSTSSKVSLLTIVPELSSCVSAAHESRVTSETIQHILGISDTAKKHRELEEVLRTVSLQAMDAMCNVSSSICNLSSDATEYSIRSSFVLVSVCQLTSKLLGPRIATDILEAHLSTRRFNGLPLECRRLMWAVRFVIQCETFQIERGEEHSVGSHSRSLVGLLRRYLVDMDPATETHRQIQRKLRRAFSYVEHKSDLHAIRQMVHPPDDAESKYGPRHALRECIDPSDHKLLTGSSLDLELLRLYLAAVPAHEQSSQCIGLESFFITQPKFALSLIGGATHDGDLRRARSLLRQYTLQCGGAIDAQAFHALVQLELREKNVHGLTHVLRHRLKVNHLDAAVWHVLTAMEIMCGGNGQTHERATEFATALHSTEGVQVLTTFVNDFEWGAKRNATENVFTPPALPTWEEKVDWSGALLYRVPSILLGFVNLHELSLCGNQLLEIPEWMGQLNQLRMLDLSQNALNELPKTLGSLTLLETLNVAHNNITMISNAVWDGLTSVTDLNLSWNALTSISPRIIRLSCLRSLKIRNNAFTWSAFAHIAAKMNNCDIDLAPSTERISSGLSEDQLSNTIKDASVQSRPQDTISPSFESDNNTVHDRAPLLHQADIDSSERRSEDRGDRVNQEDDNAGETARLTDNECTFSDVDQQNATIVMDTGESSDDEVEFVGSVAAPEHDMDSNTGTTEKLHLPAASETTTGSSSVGSPQGSDHGGSVNDEIKHIAAMSRVERERLRTQDRKRWMRYVGTFLDYNVNHGNCVLCDAPNVENLHQRFNTLFLCLSCLRDAVEAVRLRSGAHNGEELDSADEETKGRD